MATNEITFGLSQPDFSTANSRILSGVSNSTPSTLSTPSTGTGKTSAGTGGGGGGSFGGSTTTTPKVTPTTKPPTASEVSTVITTDQLEKNSGSGVNLPPAFVPQKFEANVPVPTPEDTKSSKETDTLKSENDRLRGDVKKGLDSLAKQGEFEEKISQQEGLDEKRKQKTAIDNQIMKKSREFDLALREAEDTFGTRAQKSAIKAEIVKNYNRELADLSIIQMARAGEFNDAKATVERKVRLEFQDRLAEVEALKFLYEENKERFTLAEQREYNKTILKEQRKYDEDFAEKKRLEDMKLSMLINATEAGAGNATLQNIQSATDVQSLLSLPNAQTYIKSKADRLAEQLASVNIAKANKELNEKASDLSQTGISPVTGKPYSEGQAKAGTFGVRMVQAEDVLAKGKGFFTPDRITPDWAKSADRRAFEQAERNFITAQLRRESGANIAPNEFEDARRVYIPLATDDEKTLQLKTQARSTAIQGMRNESIGAFDELLSSLQRTSSASSNVTSYLDLVDESLNDPYATYTIEK